MLLKIVYLLICRILGLIVVLARGDRAAAVEVLVLRHENAVLRRHAGRARYEPADRVWFSALARIVSRRRWVEVFPVTPATLLALAAPNAEAESAWRTLASTCRRDEYARSAAGPAGWPDPRI